MKTEMKDYIVNVNNIEWKTLIEDGVETKGIFVKVLRYDEETNRAPNFMLKFEPGAKYPYHNHPGGEEVFIIEGSVLFNSTKLIAGDFLYIPKDFKRSVQSPMGV